MKPSTTLMIGTWSRKGKRNPKSSSIGDNGFTPFITFNRYLIIQYGFYTTSAIASYAHNETKANTCLRLSLNLIVLKALMKSNKFAYPGGGANLGYPKIDLNTDVPYLASIGGSGAHVILADDI